MDAVTLRASKAAGGLLFSMYAGEQLLWTETSPLSWNSSTTYQTLQAGSATSYGPSSPHFFGRKGTASAEGYSVRTEPSSFLAA